MELTEDTPFITGHTNLDFAKDSPFRIEGGLTILCLTGEAEIILDMMPYSMKASDEAILITKSTLLLKSASKDFNALYLYCTSEMISEACNKFSSSFYNRIDSMPIFAHDASSMKNSINYIKFIQDTINDVHNRYSRVIVSNLLRNLFLYIYDRIQRNENQVIQSTRTHKDELMDVFMEKVIAHCIHHRDVEYYAGRLYISPRYLNIITKELSGLSPKDIIDNQVISELKTMLQFSNLTLSQIAEKFNFPDQSYLSRYFKKNTGISPLKYRQNELK